MTNSTADNDINKNSNNKSNNSPFYDLTFDEIVKIRLEIEAKFHSKIARGIQSKGLLESIAKRPNFKPYGHEDFPDLYSKCASLMEAIIQWHPFVDGNKRMGLAVAYYYMFKNECILLTPLSAVRFSVQIAQHEKNFQEIKEWVQLHTAHNYEEYRKKSHELVTRPMAGWLLLHSQATRENDQTEIQKANDKMDNWLARDIYPEYQKMDSMQIVEFLNELVKKLPESPMLYKRK